MERSLYDVERETSLSRDPGDLEPDRRDGMFTSTAPWYLTKRKGPTGVYNMIQGLPLYSP